MHDEKGTRGARGSQVDMMSDVGSVSLLSQEELLGKEVGPGEGCRSGTDELLVYETNID